MREKVNAVEEFELMMQAAIGSNLLMDPSSFSQLAHSIHTMAGLNTVPGNSYNYARPVTSEDQENPLLKGDGPHSKAGKFANSPRTARRCLYRSKFAGSGCVFKQSQM